MKKNKTMIVAFLTPAVLLFLLIFLYPIVRTIIMSFFKIEGVTDSMNLWSFVGLDNYVKLFNTSLFRTSFYNLFRIWLIGGLIVMSLSLLFAVILTSGIRGKKFFRAIIYMPNIVSAVALATMWLQYVFSLSSVFSRMCLRPLDWRNSPRFSGWIRITNSGPCSLPTVLVW